MLTAGSAHWRETEKILTVKSSIQQDIPKTNTIKRPNLVVENGMICLLEEAQPPPGPAQAGGARDRASGSTQAKPRDSLESAIAFLRHEMVSLASALAF